MSKAMQIQEKIADARKNYQMFQSGDIRANITDSGGVEFLNNVRDSIWNLPPGTELKFGQWLVDVYSGEKRGREYLYIPAKDLRKDSKVSYAYGLDVILSDYGTVKIVGDRSNFCLSTKGEDNLKFGQWLIEYYGENNQ